MNLKRFLIVIALVLVSSLLLTADKKDPPVPLEELKNPKSPSYVPIPYPQTREEIIKDVEYIMKDGTCYKGKVRPYDSLTNMDKILFKLFKKESGYFIGRIVKVHNRTYSRPEYYFTMDIHDEWGKVIARMSINDTGLFSAFSIPFSELRITPLMTVSEVKNYFAKSSIEKLNKAKVESIEFEKYGGMEVEYPFLKITAQTGIFYMDTWDNSIYEVLYNDKFSSWQEFIIKKSREFAVQTVKITYDRILANSLINDAKYLKKIE